ncbi:MAG: hypothetical protein HY796_00600 [Elusimicrobia bacterium]|nr:hypothetical protein [Elusimicrobiota bacterium]
MPGKKRCRYCRDWFIPDPRTPHQKTCSKPACRKKRIEQAQKNWVKKNPYYFGNDYMRVKQWLKAHPGYLAKYRAAHPEYVAKDNQNRGLRRQRLKRRSADIQDTFRLKLAGIIGLLTRPVCADIQENIAAPFNTG